ncbi:transposase [Xanthomonas oryzae pv. oryzae]|uniref:ISXo8 transposase n=1 Tax=Xanthomonas oryzae pv. oryzae (strain PXO99A) TaxID=360094 RepID=A0A0K0GIT1_XANOP|nr:ISXo8 transposase [Xanthomonas oryzae pv. oryzae PXO99A]AWK17940.1 transposase [Xanthomonas oryzae pv. oryzae]AXI17988.1 transposase [Xanthomonas oryzae pv. oryzae]AXI21073.1 transposase [Xanthomonas oryzae pv. oryzae]AXX66830.1 transposase [Xanthomonas oryzae pv. oryzae]
MLQIIVPLCRYWKTFRPRGRAVLNRTLEVRFEQYGEVVAAALSHADRKQPAHWYLKLRFPHISSCEIKHLLHQGVEEGARMGHASR